MIETFASSLKDYELRAFFHRSDEALNALLDLSAIAKDTSANLEISAVLAKLSSLSGEVVREQYRRATGGELG